MPFEVVLELTWGNEIPLSFPSVSFRYYASVIGFSRSQTSCESQQFTLSFSFSFFHKQAFILYFVFLRIHLEPASSEL